MTAPESSASVQVAVLGLGYWGPHLVRNLQELPGVEIRYVCDFDEQLVSAMTRRYPAITGTTRYADILDDAGVDAVAIATPVRTQYELAAAALRAGKHVFVEKPLAASSDDAQALITLAAQGALVLMPGHTFLYSPPVRAIRQLIEDHDLGEIYFISTSRVNLGLHQADVSVVWDLGPHDFSILCYLLGESPKHVTALSRGCILPGMPDVAFINFEFGSGTVAHVELSWLAPSKLRRTTIVGSRAMVVYDDTSTEPVRIFDAGVELPNPESFGEYRLSYRTGPIVSPPISAAEPLGLELEDFVQSIRTGAEPRSSACLGLEVVRIIEAVDSSLARRERVEVATGLDSAGGGDRMDQAVPTYSIG
jgi:predicted dehydrogenase